MCPKISGVSIVHCAGLVLATTLNLWNPSRLPKGDFYFTMHKKLAVEPIVILLHVKKLVAPINSLFELLNNVFVFDNTSKKKTSVRNGNFYIHGNIYSFVISKDANFKYYDTTDPTSLFVYAGSVIQYFLEFMEDCSLVSYPDQVAFARFLRWCFILNWRGLYFGAMLLCDGYAIMGQIENSLLFYIVDIGLRSLTFWVLRKPNEDNQYQGFAIVKKCCGSFSLIRFLDERVCNEVWYSSHTNGSLYFKQWDPGGCCLVHWVSLLDWRFIGWILLFSNKIVLLLASTSRTRLILKGKVM
jgi:hypothetical protein